MTIDLSVIGKELPAVEYEFTQRDIMLYALGIGAGADPEDLKFVYEGELEVLPTFGVVPPFPALFKIMDVEEVDISLAAILHGEQYMEVKKYPLPVKGKLISRPRVANIYDKGKGALMELEVNTEDKKGELLFYNKFGVFIRGEGGFGGEKGPEPANEPPQRDPDRVVEMKTLPQQALLYRLSGDYNPIHANPDFAQMSGFEKPILHGLCTFGFAGRAVLKEYCNNDPSVFHAIQVRFSRHVYPGESIVTEMWKESEDKVLIRSKTKERGDYCLTNGAVWLKV